MPFKTVENEGFKHLMQTVCPLYKIPSRNTFRRVDDIYDVISCEFKECLSKVQHVAITTDAIFIFIMTFYTWWNVLNDSKF